ncbi:hypothetical protein [Halovivax gelatinilyticus]|uniref:hypothetical protein n=1 Tax=Halovivax gelatinilyticus TaxID=2961597 RepID=UPI0020CA97B3|nr:hypothetical protein [Halovivax gelatinilyticus]
MERLWWGRWWSDWREVEVIGRAAVVRWNRAAGSFYHTFWTRRRSAIDNRTN